MTSTLRRLAHAFVIGSSVAGFAGATLAATPGPLEVVKKATDQFNRGDMKDATAAFANEAQIIDEFAPYQWSGFGAINTWLAGFGDFSKARDRTDSVVKIVSVIRSDVEGDTAYVVLREVYSFKEHGKPMSETGDQAFTLHKGADGWKVTGSAWAGSSPRAVVARAETPPAAAAAPAKKS